MAARNQTPKDFQLKVRTHSGMLQITSVSKMKEHQKIQLSFSGETKQTFEFSKDQDLVDSNFNLLKATLARLEKASFKPDRTKVSSILWEDIQSEIVLDFLSSYRLKSNYIRTDVLKEYIEHQNNAGIYQTWSIALILSTSKTVKIKALKGEKTLFKSFKFKDEIINEVGIASRTLDIYPSELKTKGKSNAILDKASRIVDLNLTDKAEEKEIKRVRKEKGTPLLVMVPLDPRVDPSLDQETPLVGFGIIFPELDNEEKYEYAARPLLEDFERAPQESDENEDDD